MDNNYPMIEQPKDMKIDLYPHQLSSIYQMEKLECEKCVNNPLTLESIITSIGINADITGYGKTLAMIALITRDKMDWDIDSEYVVEEMSSHCMNLVRKINRKIYTRFPTTLILAGQSIIHQWEKEFSYSPLKIFSVTTRKLAHNINPEKYDVIIITPTMYNIVIERFPNYAWKRFIYDEPSQIRIPHMRQLVCGFIWFVTATPQCISHNHRLCRNSFMKSVVGNVFEFENIIEYITVKNDDDYIKQSFCMPVTHHHYHYCFSPIYNAVNGITSEKVRKMIEAGNIYGAIQHLGGKHTDNITVLVKKEKELELREIMYHLQLWEKREAKDNIEYWRKRKEKIEGQIQELQIRVKTMLINDCVICHDKLSEPIMEPLCQNVFCGKCILTWLTNRGTCPMCRRVVNKADLTHIVEKNSVSVQEKKTEKIPTKNEKIIEIIKGKKDGRFIIFSDWNETFSSITDILQENNIQFSEVKGTHKVRLKALERFNNGKIPVLFLNSKYNGAGINLQGTTDIIMYHEMSEGTETQVIGRANRIGRKKSLEVHHLLYLKKSIHDT